MATRKLRAADINEPEGVLASRRCRAVLDLGRIREDALNRRPSLTASTSGATVTDAVADGGRRHMRSVFSKNGPSAGWPGRTGWVSGPTSPVE